MKYFFLVVLVFFYKYSEAQEAKENFFHPDSLRLIVEKLAADSMEGRFSGSRGAMSAAKFITDQFKNAGIKPLQYYNGFLMDIAPYGANVIGAIQGKSKPEEIIIFSAHYDHVGTIKTNPYKIRETTKIKKSDTIYNGANDNASGVAAVISLAKYFAKRNNNARTLLFIAFSGEELGLLGSKAMAADINSEAVKAMINIEMIGRGKKNSAPFITGSEYSNLYELMNKRLYKSDKSTYRKRYFSKDFLVHERLYFRSDNFPFAENGVAAHTIMATSSADEYYHSLNDTAATLDYYLMSRILKAIALACEGLVSAEETPFTIR